MKLERLTQRIWVFPYEEERDRPNLIYIRGDRWSLAADAGHSEEHIRSFYAALEEAGLPLPRLTVLTHWHWDHTFGMHAVHGLCVASQRTDRHLRDFRSRIEREGTGFFLAMDSRIRREYAGGRQVVVTPADLVFKGELLLDAGGCPVRVFEAESPHTDDSTLVSLPGERALILGDSTCGALPDWTVDRVLARKLAAAVRAEDPQICITGHWTPQSVQEVVQDLTEG